MLWFCEMIYGKVLQKIFHKTSLNLLDLRFKILSFRILCSGRVKGGEGNGVPCENLLALKV